MLGPANWPALIASRSEVMVRGSAPRSRTVVKPASSVVRALSRPYPYQEEAVKKAAYAGTVGANGKVSSWDDAPLGKVIGALAGMVREESLDDLIAAPSPRDAHHLMTQAVTRQVWAALPKDHIKPLQLRIGLAPSLAVAVARGMLQRGGIFERTPKFGLFGREA